jgi:amidase
LAVDPVGAFIDYPVAHLPGPGPLNGLSLAVKDLFDVVGLPTGGGHPLRRLTSGNKTANAHAVEILLGAGARLIGKTHTDEFAYSMNGENPHYGTPVNPRAPGRIPGGSSSGSAVAVAAGLADLALGTDTGGSIRLPASYCGLIGLRPTHGAIDMSGVQPLARSFDTVGWFARDMAIYRQVAALLLPGRPRVPISHFSFVPDIAAFVVGQAEADETERMVAQLGRVIERGPDVIMAPNGFEARRQVFRTIQAYEVWQDHGAWIAANQPRLGDGVRERLEWAATVSSADYTTAQAARLQIAAEVGELVPPGTALAFPTVPSAAPLPGSSGDALEAFRLRSISMLCNAGLSGLPQLSLPLGETDGMPFGLSLLGSAGSDADLLQLGDALLASSGR